MPLNLRHDLCRQFAMGAALGALLATALFAGEAKIFQLIVQGAAPGFTGTVVAACMSFYCGMGAALSGFLLIVTETRGGTGT